MNDNTTFTNKDVLMINDDINYSNAYVYYECEQFVYIHFKKLGLLYNILLRKKNNYKNMISSLIISNDYIKKFQNKIEEIFIVRLKWKNMIYNDFENENIESDNDLLNRQASIFISLIMENYDMKSSSSLIEALPALHALRQCFLSGWKPKNLPLKFIYILLASLNNCGLVDDIFNVVYVTKEIIDMILSQAAIMKNKVMIALIRLFNQNSIFGFYYVSLILECFDFLPYSLVHDIMKKSMKEIESSNHTYINLESKSWRNNLSLGDNIEININSIWLNGIIVKIDTIKEIILIEYQENKKNLKTSTLSINSDDIRPINNMKEIILNIDEDDILFNMNKFEMNKFSKCVLTLIFGEKDFFDQFVNDQDINLNEVNAKSQILNNPELMQIITSLYQLDFIRYENIVQNHSIDSNINNETISILGSFKSLLDKNLIEEKDSNEVWVDKYPRNNVIDEQNEISAEENEENANNINETKQHPLKVYEILSMNVFQSVMREILSLFEVYIDKVLEKEKLNNNVIDIPMKIINKISCSEAKCVLVPFFYRHLYFRYKIHLQQYVNQVLKDPSVHGSDRRIENFRRSILAINEIEKPYAYLLKNCCQDPLNATFLSDKLTYITKTYGTGRLADSILDHARINDNDKGIHGLMHNHVLMTTNRFSSNSKKARNFIRMLSDFVSPKYNAILSNIWVSVLAEATLKTCSKIKLNDIVAPDEVVDHLLHDLAKAREISSTDMASLINSSINADLAFTAAFKRLSKEFAIKIAKALAVRISKLLDSLKLGIQYSESWNFSINQMADLIQVLCNDSSEDFEHYYEILLARRLLWGRYMSTQNEKTCLQLLPAMTKSHLMIKDIEKTSRQMSYFRKFLLTRSDQKELVIPEKMKTLVFDNGNFVFHILAGTVWQSVLVSPLSYSSLKLDSDISAIYKEYEIFYKLRDINNHESDAVQNFHSFPSITIASVDENSYNFLGLYEPSIESSNGFPLYTQSTSPFVLEYSIKRKGWEIKNKINCGTDRYIAFFNCESFTAVPQSWPSYSSWLIKTEEGWKATTFNIILGQKQKIIASQVISITELQVNKFRSTKRLHWCHGSSSAIMKANLNEGKVCYIFASSPIATILLLYNDLKRISFSLKQLSDETCLPLKETEDVVMILSNPTLGILEDESYVIGLKEKRFRLSQKFLSGGLGGADMDDPIKIPLMQLPDLLISTDSLSSLHGWRNELIDASIVRLLKETAKKKVGEFPNKDGIPHCAIPQDILISIVKEDLARRMHLDSKDIMRRSERLVSVGVIEKISLSTNTFRSVAYAYLPEIETERSSLNSPQKKKSTKAYEKVTGDELYGHLRIILRIKTLPVGCPGISKDSFIRNFILWIAYTPCRLSLNYDKPLLAFFRDTLHDQLQMFYIQIFALKKQHDEGFQEFSDDTTNNDEEFKQYSSEIKTRYSNLKALYNFSLILHRILFDYLPADVIVILVNIFRKMQNKNFKGSLESQEYGEGNIMFETPAWDQSVNVPHNKLSHFLHPALRSHIGLEDKEHLFRRDDQELDSSNNNHRMKHKYSDTPSSQRSSMTEHLLEQLSAATASFRSGRYMDSTAGSAGASIQKFKISSSQYRSYTNSGTKYSADNDYFDDSKGDDEEFSLTFDSYVRAIFLAAPPIISKSSHSFGELLMNFLYIDVRNFAKEMQLESDGKGNKEVSSLPNVTGTESEEVLLLPCEICNDCFPISQLEHHQRLCSAVLIRGAIGNDLAGLMNRPALKPNKNKEKEKSKNQEKLNDPKWVDDDLLCLEESLFNSLSFEFCSLYGNEKITETSSLLTDKLFLTLRASLENLFISLDVNSDGYLSSDDFISKLSLKVDSIEIDPMRLYSPDRKGNSNINSPFSEDKNDNNNDTNNKCVSDDNDNLLIDMNKLSLFPSFERVDSLWASVSNDQIVPHITSSKSLKGLDETELELHLILERTCEIINESEGVTTALLLHYKWDAKSLVEDYIENQIAVRLAVGLGPKTHPPFLRFDVFGRRSVNRKGQIFTGEILCSLPVDCGICGELFSEDEIFSLNCFHWYCQTCWDNYLRIAVTDRQVKISCPCSGCKMIVTLDMIKFLCSNELYVEAQKILVKAFIEERRDRKVIATYCKNPIGCNGVLLLAEDANYTEATCSLCTSTYCVVCDLPPHAPVPCEFLADWEQRGGYLETGQDEDMEARRIKQLTTKPCPKCGTRIEKNGGCPHMSCRCKYQFCWECGGDYHTSVSCSRAKVIPNTGSILHFDQMDKEVANHFLARKVANRGKNECMKQLSIVNQAYIPIVRIKIEGWDILMRAQSALAHTCMLRFFSNSVKLEFIFDTYKKMTQDLQRKFEETWVSYDKFPEDEAKAIIRNLKLRLNDFLLDIRSELNSNTNSNNSNDSSIISIFDNSSDVSKYIFGNAFS